MAKAKHKSGSHALARWSPPRTAKPIVIRTTKVVKSKHKRHHRHHGGGMIGGLLNKTRLGIVVGSFAVGLLEKQAIFTSLPSLPLIGKTGTIGVAAYLLSGGGRNRIADEVCTAAFALAAYELASTGTVVGADGTPDVGYVAGW
jgi:hypothetical protein